MKILISGGAGFIGSRLANALVQRGHEVTVLDSLSVQVHGNNPESSPLYCYLCSDIKFIYGDVRNKEDWLRAIDDNQVIVHLAAETGTGQSMYEVERYVDTNVRGTAVLLNILANKEKCVRRVVVASSRSIYGEGKYISGAGVVYPSARDERDLLNGNFECKCPITGEGVKLLATDEGSLIQPSSIYGITKYNQEQMVIAMGKACGFSAIAFRYQNVYGPGQSLKNPYTGILSIFSTQFLQGNDVNIFEDGKESRDFVYVDDVVDATIKGIEIESNDCNVYNVGSGVPTDVLSIANILKKSYEANGNIVVTGNFRLGDIRHNYADLTKIKSELGFVPRINFSNGIAEFVKWVKTQDVVESGYLISLNEMRSRGFFK